MPRIFLSHKHRDAQAAEEIKKLITRRFPTSADVFLSSDARDLRGGNLWREKIHDELRQADWLVILFGDHRENWDWCVYEGAYFAGRHDALSKVKLTILHPEGAQPPTPFSEWQRVAADRKGIKGWLRNIFSEAEKESEVLGEAGFSELADELASVLQSLAVQPWLPEHIINIEIPSHQPDKECPSILTGAVVRSSSTAALILQLAQRPEIEWESIEKHLSDIRFDIDGLCCVIENVRLDSGLVPQVLSLFRSPHDDRGYRPVITRADRTSEGTVRVQLMLVEIPATFDVDLAEDFDYSFHTFSLAARFRWQVIERFSDQLEQTNEEDHGAVATVLSNLNRAIEAVRTESHNRGLRDLNQLLKRLPEPIRASIRQASKAFESGFKSLQKARETNDLMLAQESFVLMRTSNFEFTRISLMNLTEIIDRNTRLPEIERLRPELKAAIPDAVRTRFEVTGNPPGGSGATTISTQLAQLTQPIAAIHQSSEDREASPASKPR